MILPRMADIKGRKPVYLFSVILLLIAQIGVFLSTDIWFTIAMITVIGLTVGSRVPIAIMFCNEFVMAEN